MARNSDKDLLEKVKVLFNANRRTGRKFGRDFYYTCPSSHFYTHQWLWDSCFHAIILTHFDPESSKKEIKTLLSSQSKEGFVPCVTLWQKNSIVEKFLYMLQAKNGITMITQPPVIPQAVEMIFKKTLDKTFLIEVYPKLKLLLDWLIRNRDQNNNGLLEIIHPWEAGCDSIPSFDKQLGIGASHPSRPKIFYALYRIIFRYHLMDWNNEDILKSRIFISENVLFNSVYAQALASMVFLSSELGKKGDSKIFMKRYQRTKSALIKLCWSERDHIFYDLDQDQNQIEVKSISSLMPLILPDLPKDMVESIIKGHLLNRNEFWTNFPIPSVPKSEPSFNSGEGSSTDFSVLWRGPTWINTNWFLAKALEVHGYKRQAMKITRKSVELIKKSGFREFYNPLTGEGYGKPDFSWSALVIDMP
jgi:glycogen debranching enzyme